MTKPEIRTAIRRAAPGLMAALALAVGARSLASLGPVMLGAASLIVVAGVSLAAVLLVR